VNIEIEFLPEIHKIYTLQRYSLFYLKTGNGTFEVDFRNYNFEVGTAIFLSPGQYFQLISGSVSITICEFQDENIAKLKNSRFLFNHLVSVGHIELKQPEQYYLKPLHFFAIDENDTHLLFKVIEEWKSFNPFKASSSDIELLFDLKEIIDEKYREPLDIQLISKRLNQKSHRLNSFAKEKLNHTIHKLVVDKILLEAKRKVTFTNLTVKEIAYETGFKDPDYFNRFFKQQTSKTPVDFRSKYEYDQRDTLLQDVNELIHLFYKNQHSIDFYADQLAMTTKSLSQRIKKKSSLTLKELIQNKLISEARNLLQERIPVNEIAYELGFKEPNHFTAFFKNSTGQTPSQFLKSI